MQALRMMMAGVFNRLPELQIILGHWGEVVSFFARRMDEIGRGVTGLQKDFSDYFKENVYVNPSGMLYGEQFRYCLEFFGPERILWGAGLPLSKTGEHLRLFGGLSARCARPGKDRLAERGKAIPLITVINAAIK